MTTEDIKKLRRHYPEKSINSGVTYVAYTQSPIIRNGPIRLGIEFWGKFKKRALGRSNLRNAR